MTPRALARLLGAWLALLVVSAIAVARWAALAPVPPSERLVVATEWRNGEKSSRRVRPPEPGDDAPDGTAVLEVGVAEAPLLARSPFFELGLVPGLDGVRASLGGRTAVVTVDDLLREQGYDRASGFASGQLTMGADRELVLARLGEQLGVSARDVAQRATLRRVRFERRVPRAKPAPRVTAEVLDPAAVRAAVKGAGEYLARGQDDRGRYRYLVNALENKTIAGYNLPRHAGATFFMAQAAGLLGDARLRWAVLMAAGYLRKEAMGACGPYTCVIDDGEANAGSAALAVIAFTELVRRQLDDSFVHEVRLLAAFLRSLQRPDGELMHEYDRAKGRPIDVQRLYFSGEAALALARAHRVTGDPADLEASKRLLARLVGTGWSFFGSRYYWGEEHWTCQAMAELWDRAPNEDALTFCLRWHAYQQKLQYDATDSPMDAEGAFGFGSFVSPRLTPASSRGEAGAATLAALRAARPSDPAVGPLQREIDRAVAFVMRHQFTPGPTHLFADPIAVQGGVPGSSVDWTVRMDYPQHAGSMMVRWLELRERAPNPP
ncbi:MAG: hypothetical protein JNL38_10215 [Myxococcales bacterium]|jgi:hypothetical protein|nr:hypothetical protein [Myxococcales bacterium]